jgi:3-oxoacid CoA-transferase
MRGSSRNFVPAFAKAARVAIVEVDEIVEVGEIPAENIGLPAILVSRVVKKTVEPDQARLAPRRPADKPREYNGKPSWTRQEMAQKTAALLKANSYVNLGTGIPTLVSNYIEGRDITLHGENGILGYGEMVEGDLIDHDIFNASGQYVQALPGVSYFDSVTSFEMARSGKLHAVVLGAYQVDQEGNLANFSLGDPRLGGIGGAMDLVAGKQQLIIMMEHRDSKDRPKLVRHVQYPKTGVNCVDVVVTDLAILRRLNGEFVIEEVADGFSFEEVQALTDMDVKIPTGA